MRIGIDLRHIALGPSGGIATLVRDVVTAAVLGNRDHQWCAFATIFNAELFEISAPNLAIVSLPLSSFWSRLELQLAERKIDVLFRSYPVVDSLQFPLNRQLVLIPEHPARTVARILCVARARQSARGIHSFPPLGRRHRYDLRIRAPHHRRFAIDGAETFS